jgi:PadR family transcriptional regulator PadR
VSPLRRIEMSPSGPFRRRKHAGTGHHAERRRFKKSDAFQQPALHLLETLCRVPTMGTDDRLRMSLQTLKVLEAFLADPTLSLSGADVHQQSKIPSGTLYPILLRLESAGWFVSRWESVDPSAVGRPRRRLYRLTSTGLRRASEVFATFNRGILT